MFNVIIIIYRKKKLSETSDGARLPAAVKGAFAFLIRFCRLVKNVQQFMIEFDSRFSLPI